MAVLKCHQDVLQPDGRALLLRYVGTYVPKLSDAFPVAGVDDAGTDFSIAKRVLFDYHPGEPEMWLTLAAKSFPACFCGGTLVGIVAPYAGMATKPRFVELYEAARCPATPPAGNLAQLTPGRPPQKRPALRPLWAPWCPPAHAAP